MDLRCQQSAIQQLHQFAKHDKHSIIIEGDRGVGKSYLSKYYANILQISNYISISPTVDSIRNVIEACASNNSKFLVSIENLELGVVSASSTLLKFLEEPNSNVYIVITTCNSCKLLDTIISRSVVTTIGHPNAYDIIEYAKALDISKYNKYSTSIIWRAVRSFSDVQNIFKLSDVQISYIESIPKLLHSQESISSLAWKFGHFADNVETPIELILQLILATTKDRHTIITALECLQDLSSTRVAKHVCLSKFLFEIKYCE